jgi:hypothetical protein
MSLTPARTAAGFALLMAVAAGCGAADPLMPAGAQPSSPASAVAAKAPAAPTACSLLKPADVLAVAATVPHDTITIDGHTQDSKPPTNECGYNQKGVFTTSDGITTTLSGDQWAPSRPRLSLTCKASAHPGTGPAFRRRARYPGWLSPGTAAGSAREPSA